MLGGWEKYDFRGRIAVKAADDGFNGKLNWKQQRAEFEATVSGPLGIGTVRIAGNGGAVTVTDKDGVKTRLRDAETDLQARYGWTIPVQSLRYWALGLPDPARRPKSRRSMPRPHPTESGRRRIPPARCAP